MISPAVSAAQRRKSAAEVRIQVEDDEALLDDTGQFAPRSAARALASKGTAGSSNRATWTADIPTARRWNCGIN